MVLSFFELRLAVFAARFSFRLFSGAFFVDFSCCSFPFDTVLWVLGFDWILF